VSRIVITISLGSAVMTNTQHPKVRERVGAGVERRPPVDVVHLQALGGAAAVGLAAVPGRVERRSSGPPPPCAVALRALRL